LTSLVGETTNSGQVWAC